MDDNITIKIIHNNTFEFSPNNNKSIQYIDKHNLSIISKIKKKIDSKNIKKNWKEYRLYTNKYEQIFNKSNMYMSISRKYPVSRSFFKLHEMIFDYDLINYSQSTFTYAGLAEAPGGFIQAVQYNRKKQYVGRFDKYFCISLINDTDSNSPSWAKIFNNISNITFVKGTDNTGNILKIENILDFKNTVNVNKMDLITADGAINNIKSYEQEQNNFKLFFSEIVIALSIQRVGGHFVLKIFDIITSITMEIIHLLSKYYEEIIITKPHMSRPANSEKYIIAKKFKGIETNILQKMYDCYNDLNFTSLTTSKLPDIILKQILKFNNLIIKKQANSIHDVIDLIHSTKPNIDIENNLKLQKKIGIEWCDFYKIDHI